ncbi:MAG TPA: hypothetical protein VK178_04525 [Opitutaceae bacterium]|nr:hypothetical protein [Opitutaceae bacterium]
MSLINDALKKAQRERSGPAVPPASTPPVPPPPGVPPSHRAAPPKGFPWGIVLIALAVVGGGAAVWFLKPSAPAPTPTVAANTATATPPSPAATEQPPALQINVPNASALTPATAPSPAPTSAAPTPAPAAVVSTPPAATPPPAQPAPEPAAAPAFKVTLQMEDPRVLAFLDAARINGVRSVADDAKLLMNNKVFRAGAVVDRELGLKLIQILPTELVFEDSHGIQYRKPL